MRNIFPLVLIFSRFWRLAEFLPLAGE